MSLGASSCCSWGRLRAVRTTENLREGRPSFKKSAGAATSSKCLVSPLKTAPPMRDIYARYAPRELQAELQEGMVSKHKEMPQIEFSDEDVDAILAYLHALAVRK